jgi:hypothetical protein
MVNSPMTWSEGIFFHENLPWFVDESLRRALRANPWAGGECTMNTSIVLEGLDVDDLGHVVVKLSQKPTEQWMELFRDYWGTAGTPGSTAVKKEAFSHFSDQNIVFRGIDVDGFVDHCRGFTSDATKYDARIRDRSDGAGRDQKHVEAERAKARKVKFN